MIAFVGKILIFAFLVTLPNGPIGFLTLREIILKRSSWMWIAFGAALSDIFYALIVLLGMIHIQKILLAHSGILQTIAAFLLIGIGLVGLRKSYLAQHYTAIVPTTIPKSMTPLESFMIGFVGCVANPTLLFSFTGTLTALRVMNTGLVNGHNFPIIIPLILIGEVLTWWAIYHGVMWVQRRYTISVKGISIVSNYALLLFGVALLVTSMRYGITHGFIPWMIY